jgi:Domain of unknown function (DUF4397)
MIGLATMLVGISAANASALQLRFVHAVPGAGSAELTANGKPVGGAVGFGGVTDYSKLGSGRDKLELKGGGKTLASATRTLGGGRYTVVAASAGGGPKLQVYSDGRATGGKARVRAVNAAAELGNTEVMLAGTPVAKDLAPGKASPYTTVDPGTYKLEAMRPTGKGGALASRSGVNLTAGTSATAFVVGSGGEPTRIVLASDTTVTPSKAPGTGLGGESGGTPWAAVIAVALSAGALGGAAFLLASRRRRHGA